MTGHMLKISSIDSDTFNMPLKSYHLPLSANKNTEKVCCSFPRTGFDGDNPTTLKLSTLILRQQTHKGLIVVN